MAALPIPETARPTMNAVDDCAAADIIDPTSNMTTLIIKIHLGGKNVYIKPRQSYFIGSS